MIVDQPTPWEKESQNLSATTKKALSDVTTPPKKKKNLPMVFNFLQKSLQAAIYRFTTDFILGSNKKKISLIASSAVFTLQLQPPMLSANIPSTSPQGSKTAL